MVLGVQGLHARRLYLGAQHLLLRADRRRVTHSRGLLHLLPDVALLESQSGEPAGEQKAVVGALHRAYYGEAGTFHVETGCARVGLRDSPAQAELPGIGEVLPAGDAEHRHRLPTQAGPYAVVLVEDADGWTGAGRRLNGSRLCSKLELTRSEELRIMEQGFVDERLKDRVG